MKKILIPTDFSDNARNATNYAIALFDHQDTTFTFIHSLYVHYSSDEVHMNFNANAKEEAKGLFEIEKQRIEHSYPSLQGKLDFYFELGEIVDVVSSYAETEKADYVVMGTKGASGLKEVLVGSRTASMIKNIDCPLFVVPENASFTEPKKILFTTDRELQNDNLNLQALTQLAQKYDSMVHGLYVSKTGEDMDIEATFVRYDLDIKLVDIKHDLEVDVNAKPVDAIENYMKKYQVDLIAMVSTKGNLFHELFHKSVTKKIAMHTDIPMLIMHTNI